MVKIGYMMNVPCAEEYKDERKWMEAFCRIHNIRHISLRDKIDSANQLFPETQTSDVLTTITLLPKAMSNIERNKRVVNTYLQGFSIDDIFRESGFRSRSNVFRILNLANMDLNRSRTKGPLSPRKKKENNVYLFHYSDI